MRPLYTRKTELTKRINKYFKEERKWTPRAYRVYLGLSKQMLNKYKREKPEGYAVIMEGQERILAGLEQQAIYNQDLSRAQVTSIIFTLRAYDADQYIPEIRDKEISNEREEAIIQLDIKEPKKKGMR